MISIIPDSRLLSKEKQKRQVYREQIGNVAYVKVVLLVVGKRVINPSIN
jgi:hypothetical protein